MIEIERRDEENVGLKKLVSGLMNELKEKII